MRSRILNQSRKRREGAAMFVVMMVILAGTASALFGVHMTTMELRGAGFAGQREKVGNVAESAVNAGISYLDAYSPAAIVQKINEEAARCGQDPDCASAGTCDTTCPFVGQVDDPYKGTIEPPLAEERGLYRIYPEFFEGMIGAVGVGKFGSDPFQSEATDIYKPWAMIDYYDNYPVTRVMAGVDDTGRQDNVKYVEMKITARGRLRLDKDNDGTYDDVASTTGGVEDNNVAARSARAYLISGPL